MKIDILRRSVAELIGTFALVFIGCTTRAMVGDTTNFAGILPALTIEVILTFFLMLVNMASATDKRFKRSDSGLMVGFIILVAGLMGNSLSGASMNPARSLGTALFAGGSPLASVWIYFVAPFIGAILAVGVYQVIRGGDEHTKDVLEEPPDEDKAVTQKNAGNLREAVPAASD